MVTNLENRQTFNQLLTRLIASEPFKDWYQILVNTPKTNMDAILHSIKRKQKVILIEYVPSKPCLRVKNHIEFLKGIEDLNNTKEDQPLDVHTVIKISDKIFDELGYNILETYRLSNSQYFLISKP